MLYSNTSTSTYIRLKIRLLQWNSIWQSIFLSLFILDIFKGKTYSFFSSVSQLKNLITVSIFAIFHKK